MAIDSSLFMAELPAGTYAAGDTVELTIKAGPGNVRSGRGSAILKRMTVGVVNGASGSVTYWKVTAKNSDWVDGMASLTAPLISTTCLDERAGSVQRGNDCPLTPNSTWSVVATCVIGGTTTVDNDIFAIIDIDYPSVSSIVDPDILLGIPTTIDYNGTTITVNATGTSDTAKWDTVNVDIFKAGFEYALQKVELVNSGGNGFVALANAAGMSGLQRIIPVSGILDSIRNKIEYATKLVKGPMDIKYMIFSSTATTSTPDLILDFVKRRM